MYQVHYLQVEAGENAESRWGHSMFRIILCNPKRKKVDHRCLRDVEHHVTVSFLADIRDTRNKHYNGLTGKYPSLLFVQPFKKTIIEYGWVENRRLTSLPLKFSDLQKRKFIMQTLSRLDSYVGKYYFLSNNCMTESLNLLKEIIQLPRFQISHPRTPIGLYKVLAKERLIDAELLQNHKAAVESGYIFEPRLYYLTKK